MDGVTGRAVSTGRFNRRTSASRVATAEKEREAVVEDSTTMRTVQNLNAQSLSEFRCHNILEDAAPDVNPFAMVADDVAVLNDQVCDQLDGVDTDLVASAQHFFGAGNTREGKRVRPVIVNLMGQACSQSASLSEEQTAAAYEKHKQLAAITEMIHTASLVHDDVLDGADTRRGGDAVHKLFSTKAAVLSGDFLLARASVALARLETPQVVQEMAKSLEALVQGEIMQLQSTAEERLSLEYVLPFSPSLGLSPHPRLAPPSAFPLTLAWPSPPLTLPRPPALLTLPRPLPASRSPWPPLVTLDEAPPPDLTVATTQVLPDEVVLQDGLAHGLLLQVGCSPLLARARVVDGHRRRKVRVPLRPCLPGELLLAPPCAAPLAPPLRRPLRRPSRLPSRRPSRRPSCASPLRNGRDHAHSHTRDLTPLTSPPASPCRAQVIDDLLDFTGTSDTLGKPGLQDMALGLSTAPVLYGIDEHPELKLLVERKFGEDGDVQRACELVLDSQGLQRTKDLATFHAQAAVDACCSLPASTQRDALIQLCHVVLSRSS